jgi:peptidoglycan/LPS O-acetylase OafA/YrhL
MSETMSLSPTLQQLIVSREIPSSDIQDVLTKGSIALDQWRGLALVLVLISHGFFFTNRVSGAGRIGVNLFFFISGILSYRSLQNRNGGTLWELVRSFWWRRLRRLYPALVAYTFTMLIAMIFLQKLPNLPPRSNIDNYLDSLPYALTYCVNYVPRCPVALGHLWSLAVEMQFYILAPLIFVLGGKSVHRRMLVFGVAVLSSVGVGLFYPLLTSHYEALRYHFEIAAWPMMAGFACEFAKRWFLKMKKSHVNAWFGLGVTALIIAMIAMPFGPGMKRFVVATGGILLFPCLLGYLFGLSFPGKIGNFLAWIGERTYSIYLWQEPLTICNFLPPVLHPAGAVVSVIVGAYSFRMFEKPFLSVGRARQVSSVAMIPAASSD